MRYVNFATAALLALTALPALAQAPPGQNPTTGARPGHEPGVGESLPRSDKASNIGREITVHHRPHPTPADYRRKCDHAGLSESRPCRSRHRSHRAGAAIAGDGGDTRHSIARFRKARRTRRARASWSPKSGMRAAHWATATARAPFSSSISPYRAETRFLRSAAVSVSAAAQFALACYATCRCMVFY